MEPLSLGAARIALRLALSFVAIVVVLATAKFLLAAYDEHLSASGKLEALKRERQKFDTWRQDAATAAAARVAALETAPLDALDRRIADIDASVVRLAQPVGATELSVAGAREAILDKLTRDAQRAMLVREREVLLQVRAFRAGPDNLEALRQWRDAADVALAANERAQRALRTAYSLLVYLRKAERDEMSRLRNAHEALAIERGKAQEAHERQRKANEVRRMPERVFESLAQTTDDALRQVDGHIEQGELEQARSWVGRGAQAVREVTTTALWIMVAVILTPIAIKAVFYYVLAPLAARRPPICLLPNASGRLAKLPAASDDGAARLRISAVSLPLALGPGQVLLVHPDFLQSSAIGARTDTRWLLDWRYPVASLAAGMRALTRVRVAADDTVVVSATRDPLSEVGLLAMPEGTSFVLHPRSLVGVVHASSEPLRIASLWRLFSLHAWLTLQLRYLVFHGPASLIVKGCRGVRVERAGAGRRINQAATIGFAANLRYTTSRCETFASYLFGQRELLNDSFAGAEGYYVYEETPHRRGSGGLFGRGLEGIADSLLRVLGI